jgi:hypothetical protein
MKKFIEHIQKKEPHARRTHALQVAGVVTVVVFMVWITTLSVRFGGDEITEGVEEFSSQLAAPAALQEEPGGVEVSQTSIFQ